ncbi:MAG: carbonic anhydrase [Acidobacteriota bacterium]
MIRRRFLTFSTIALLSTLIAATGLSQQKYPEPHTQTLESNERMTPAEAKRLLEEGNKRFIAGALISRPIRQQVRETAKGQFPFANILSCQDSRTSSQLLFDLNNGDVFTLKVAGNVANPDMLGGLEFGTGPHYAKLIAVVGHTDCGAIKGTIDSKAAIDAGARGNLLDLLRRIRPALDMVDPRITPRDSKNPEYVTAVAKANVELVMKEICANSKDLRDRIISKRWGLIGGLHNVATGEVLFFRESDCRDR